MIKKVKFKDGVLYVLSHQQSKTKIQKIFSLKLFFFY